MISERDTLLGVSSENLDQLATLKSTLLDALVQLSTQNSVGKMSESAEAINRCFTLNRENSQLVNQNLKTTRQSLEILRHHIGDSAVTLYDTTGKLKHKVGTRKIIKV